MGSIGLRPVWGVTTLISLLIALGSCAPSSPPTRTPATFGSADTFFLKASPQTSDGKSVGIDEVVFRGTTGYVAIHANGNGAPGVTIGVSALLPAGTSTHVKVVLSKPLLSSGSVFAVLHLEDNGNKTFDYPHGDAPVSLNGQVVVVEITVTVQK